MLERACGFESHPRHIMSKFKSTLSLMWLPIFAFTALCSFYVLWALLDLPPKEEVVEIAKLYFEKYGLITIFVCAIIEGALFAGWYFPGSFVIVLGVFLAGDDYVQLFGVFAVTTVGLLIAYMFNFYLGKYGWDKVLTALGFQEPLRKAQGQLVKYGPRGIFLTFWHPNFAALTSTAAGILHMPLQTFALYAVSATVLWDIFWTIVGYTLGEAALTVIGPQYVIAFIAIWVAAVLFKKWRTAAREKLSGETSQ